MMKTTNVAAASNGQYEKMMGRIRISLIPQRGNRQILETAVHIDFDDLSVVAYEVAGQDAGIIAWPRLVTKGAIDELGITQKRFLTDAIAASERNYPGMLKPLNAVLGYEAEEGRPQIYLATMPDMKYGAGVIMYPGFMLKAARKLGRSFYIIPSSIHEVLFVRDSEVALNDIEDTVRDINREQVADIDQLSDHIYHYSTVYGLESGRKYLARTDSAAGGQA